MYSILSLSLFHIAGSPRMLGLPLVAVVVDMLGMSRKRDFELSVVDVRIYAQCLGIDSGHAHHAANRYPASDLVGVQARPRLGPSLRNPS
jgi:hypothetical protein